MTSAADQPGTNPDLMALHSGSDEVDRRIDALDRLENGLFEMKFRQNLENWLGLYLWPLALVPVRSLDRVTEMIASGGISATERRALRDLDFIVSGKDADGEDTLIAAEVSIHIDGNDIARVVDRAKILERAGYRVKPLVGGVSIGDAAAEVADRLGVIVDLHDLPH